MGGARLAQDSNQHRNDATAHFSFCRTLLEHTVSAESIPCPLPRTQGTSLTWHDSRSQRAAGSRQVKLLQQPGTEAPQGRLYSDHDGLYHTSPSLGGLTRPVVLWSQQDVCKWLKKHFASIRAPWAWGSTQRPIVPQFTPMPEKHLPPDGGVTGHFALTAQPTQATDGVPGKRMAARAPSPDPSLPSRIAAGIPREFAPSPPHAEPSARIHWLLRVRGLRETAWGPAGPVRGSCRPGDSAESGAGQQRPGWLQGQQPGLSHAQLSLMNQWKDEFKAHSRVKCPNAGCWLEFPSIYGLKYHYQRCQGGAISERLTFPCPFCEAAFTSKTQLEKHRIWNHMDRPLPAPKPGPVSRPVTVSRPVGVSKPIGVSKPVTISKPIGISKPVTVSRPVPVTKPVTVSRPVPVTKPVMASRPVPVTKAVPVTRPVPVNKPIPVTKSVPIAKPVTVNKPVPVTKPVTINKPVSVTKLVTVTKPVPVAKPVTVSRPIVVSKPVTVSRPIAISRHTPPCKMVLLTKSENKAPRAAGRSSGKKRAADGLDACPLPPKQARPENGEYGPSTTDQSSAFPLSTDPSSSPLSLGSRPLGGKEAPRAAGPVSLPEEGAERTKHSKTRAGGGGRAGAAASRPEPPDGYLTRAFVLCFLSPESGRKQKTPKKFTGLAKAEDKARIHRAKKQEGPVPEEARKKGPAPTSAVSKEVPAPVAHPAPGGPEEQWQRAIHERGEAVCPTCNVVTRKTLVGLKKHMEVCQKLQDALKCQHCRKQFKSKAGLNYHTMAEHSAKPSDAEASEGSEQERRERLRKVLKQMGRLRCPQEEPADKAPEAEDLLGVERTPSGRIRRTSAQVAVFHLQEIAEDELARDWTKRRMKDDLVPETARLNYTRPGLPVLNPQLLEEWKNEVKEKGHVNCPNDCCEAVYSSVSGLKAHLAGCSKGDHLVGKYCCLLCPKEFSSESGVKYHILKAHAENWFRTSADPPPRHKGPDSLVPRKEKSPAGGKKRGRKPKERPPEDPAPGTPPHRDDWPPGGRDKGARGSAGRKVGAGKAPEK
ncbi:zinc finger domain-containing protein, partial [Eschrichtius robustus]|nr:zinc finger domain-containing protein [Eschrichtius robustus]